MAKKEYQDRWLDKRARLERRELECERLKWVTLEDRKELIAAGYLDPADIDDPDAVSLAWQQIWLGVRRNIQKRFSR